MLFDQTIVFETVQTVVLSARVEGEAPGGGVAGSVCVCVYVCEGRGGREGGGESMCACARERCICSDAGSPHSTKT